MDDNHLTIGGQLHIELDRIRAFLYGLSEGWECIFRCTNLIPAVSNNEWCLQITPHS
jgi:hypothetical protein